MSENVGSIAYDARITTSQFSKDADTVEKRAGDVASSVEKSGNRGFTNFASQASTSFNSVADGLGRVLKSALLIGTTGSLGIGAATKASWDQVSAVQQATVALNAYEKDGTKVNAVLKDLVSYARSDLGVLFNRKDLFDSAQSLKIMGDNTSQLTDHVKILSRSVGLGLSNWTDLNLIVGRVGSTGRLTGEDFDNLTKAGYKLDPALRNTNITFDQLFKSLDKGIPADAMAGQANTIVGLGVRLQTAFRGIGDAILGVDADSGKFVEGGLGSKLIGLMGTLTTLLKDPALKDGFKRMGQQIGDFATKALPVLIEGFSWIVNNSGTVVAGVAALAAAFTAAKLAAIGFSVAAALNPIGLIAGAIIGLVAGLTYLEVKFGIVSKTFKGLYDLIVKGDFTKAFGEVFHLQEDSPIVKTILTIRDVFVDFAKHAKELGGVLGKELSPVFEIISKHADVLKYVLGAMVGLVLLPLITFVASLVVGLKVLGTVLGFIASHFETVKKVVMVGMAVAFAPLIAILTPIILLIKNWGNIMDWFVGIWQKAFQAVSKWIHNAKEDVSQTFNSIKQTVTEALNAALKVVTDVMTNIWHAIDGPLNFIKNLYIIVWGSIALVVLTALTTIKDGIVTAFNFIWGIIKTVVGWISDIYTTAFTWWSSLVLNTFDKIRSVIWDAMQFVWNIISTVTGWIWDRIVTAFNFYKDVIVNAFTAVLNFITTVWDTIYRIISGVVTAIINFFAPAATWLYNAGVSILNGLVNGIKAMWGAVWWAIKSAGDQIGNFFTNAGSWLYGVGQAIVQGLINGIKSMVGAVSNAAGEVGDAVQNKVKNLLGIHSPSTVFAGFGKNIVQGLAVGIDKNARLATNSVGSMVGSMGVGSLSVPNMDSLDALNINPNKSSGSINVVNNNYSVYDQQKALSDLAWQLR